MEYTLNCKGRLFTLAEPQVMGILNVTPDSFYADSRKQTEREIAERTQTIETMVEELVNARKVANRIESEREKAIAYHDTVEPKMDEIRYHIDKLELTVADELWTLPKYREMLFIR